MVDFNLIFNTKQIKFKEDITNIAVKVNVSHRINRKKKKNVFKFLCFYKKWNNIISIYKNIANSIKNTKHKVLNMCLLLFLLLQKVFIHAKF